MNPSREPYLNSGKLADTPKGYSGMYVIRPTMSEGTNLATVDSPTYDYSGYSAWSSGDLRVQPGMLLTVDTGYQTPKDLSGPFNPLTLGPISYGFAFYGPDYCRYCTWTPSNPCTPAGCKNSGSTSSWNPPTVYVSYMASSQVSGFSGPKYPMATVGMTGAGTITSKYFDDCPAYTSSTGSLECTASLSCSQPSGFNGNWVGIRDEVRTYWYSGFYDPYFTSTISAPHQLPYLNSETGEQIESRYFGLISVNVSGQSGCSGFSGFSGSSGFSAGTSCPSSMCFMCSGM